MNNKRELTGGNKIGARSGTKYGEVKIQTTELNRNLAKDNKQPDEKKQ